MNQRDFYKSLLSEFGPQGWWPVTEPRGKKPTYKKRASLTERQKFEVCAGAILTQNTSWKNVEKAIENLLRANAMSVGVINSIPKKRLALLVKPSGYFNQKAGRLKKFCAYIEKNYRGDLGKMLSKPSAELRPELLSLHGIGPETADSILLYAAGWPVFVVDAYTKRIAERFYGKEFRSYEELRQFFESRTPRSAQKFNEFHALLVELGKNYCIREPKCTECPINKNCCYHT